MQHFLRIAGTLCLLLGTYVSYSQSLIHYWDFNTSTSEAAQLTPSSILTGASASHIAGGTGPSVIQITSNTAQDFELSNLNARNSSVSGSHLRLNTPIGGTLVFSIPTTGYEQITVKYVTRRSTQGAGKQVIEYSTDGTSFTAFSSVIVTEVPTLQTLDFSSIAQAKHNANFKIRITFEAGAGGTGGNDRMDNFTVEGVTFGADNAAPTVVFAPVADAENIAVNTSIKLTFNETIRLINDAAITASDIASFVELRKTNAAGETIAFTATISEKEITLTPSASLSNNTVYYVVVAANKIEDASNNAITSIASSTFRTSAIQTVFQAGDIIPIAYRTNATDVADEVALLTLVDILPGTRINMTDAKFTSNTPAQCAGGLVWIAPASGVAAGTVIVIGNDANTASVGSLTGSTFGLSSSGDQFIVYTGTNTNPNYITAVSSNAWATANTSCSGSNSLLPAGLTDGTSSINTSTAPGNTTGNSVNAYYTGSHSGTPAQIRAAVLNPANWVAIAGSTAGQTWPSWAFPGPPSILSATVLNQTQIRIAFNTNMDAASTTALVNYTGINALSTIVLTNNGLLADTAIITYTAPFTAGVSHTLTIRNVKNDGNITLFTPYQYTFTYNTTLAWDKTHVIAKEADGTVSLKIKILNPSAASFGIMVKPASFNTASAADFTFATQTITLAGTEIEKIVTIPITNDTEAEADEYFVLELTNPAGASVAGSTTVTVFIRDNDMVVEKSESISLSFTSRFTVANPNNAEGIAEIVAYDPVSKRLFTISTGIDKVDIINFTDPANPVAVSQIDMTAYGKGLTSVAVKNEIVAVTVTGLTSEQENGSVVFFTTNGTFINKVTAGALPDMVTFTPDGKYVLTANEGQPNDSYSIDPEGSVSIINITGGIAALTQNNVATIDFTSFNAQEAALRASGVRKTKASSTLSQDLEPEYITVSADSKKAWVSLQENNAIAEINLETATVTNINALGTKDYSLTENGFDASDNNSGVVLSNWPVKGFYMPDAIANYTVGGVTYLVTANEGDEKEYGGLVERTTVGAVTLDPVKFPNAAALQQSYNLGRFRISNVQGDTDNDGDYDELYAVGARSFAIWDAATGALVYDSGSEFERITETDPQSAAVFNSDNASNAFKNRSRAKGPEPEGVTLAVIGTNTYAFITLERTGGVMVYDVTDPNAVSFVQYINSRSTTSFAGDNGPEGIIFIDATVSPNGKPYVISANEMSGTLAIFEVSVPVATSILSGSAATHTMLVYPNPTKSGKIYFSEEVSGKIVDIRGTEVAIIHNASEANVQALTPGVYMIVMSSGQTAKFIVE